jgi:DNA polymerase-3 subunit gamma/tau
VRDEDVSALLGLIDRELLLAASRAVAAGDSLAALELVERLSDYGADYRNFTRELILHFREILLLKVAPGESVLVAQLVPEERERLAPVAAALSEEDLLRIFEVLAKAETDLRLAQDPRVTLEMALLKIVQMQRLLPFAELVARVERLAGGVSAPAPTPRTPEIAAAPRPLPRPEPPPVAAPVPAPRAAEARTPPPIFTATLPGPSTEPAPMAAPAAPAPTTATLADGAEAVLQAMVWQAQARPSRAQPLRAARARQEGDALVLEFAPDFFRMADEHADEYRDLARKASGRPLKVKIVSAAAAAAAAVTGETEASAPERKRQRLMEEASREPAVQEALDLFGGRVVDVRETKS